jgi:bifunctional non-homologous end joining protein LigD
MLMFSPPRLARDRLSPPGFIRPALLTLATTVPTGPGWIHELYDGFRMIVRKSGEEVRIWSRYGRSRKADFAAIVAGFEALDAGEIVVDGEAVAFSPAGLPDFNRLLTAAGQPDACLVAYDLLAVDGEDLRPLPLLARRKRLQELFAAAPPALRFSEHMEGPDGATLFRHACAMGLEGIVSKKVTAPYLSGRRSCWRKIKNPTYARAVASVHQR